MNEIIQRHHLCFQNYEEYVGYVLIDVVQLNLILQVRIFTFSVGQHNYDKGPIQWMACSNKGTAQIRAQITQNCYRFVTILVLDEVVLVRYL